MPLIRKSQPPPGPVAGVAAGPSALLSDDPDERWTAARTVGGVAGGMDALRQALPRERDSRVRLAILSALANDASPASIEAIVAGIRADDAQLRTSSLDALRTMGDATRSHVPMLLRDPDPDVRILSCELTRNFEAGEATQMLCEVLDHDDEQNVCAAAVEVLAEIGERAALPSLARCAARFPGTPFLAYSIELTVDRIRDVKTPSRE